MAERVPGLHTAPLVLQPAVNIPHMPESNVANVLCQASTLSHFYPHNNLITFPFHKGHLRDPEQRLEPAHTAFMETTIFTLCFKFKSVSFCYRTAPDLFPDIPFPSQRTST